jgi:hypothetical protein
MKNLTFQLLPDLTFSPDSALSGFYLFGTIKGMMRKGSFQDAEERVKDVRKVASFIRPSELNAVFRN